MTTNWKIFGASVIGQGHILNNLPCQDAHYHKKINRRWILAITCDGAGSYENSHIGSRFIAKTLSKRISDRVIGNKLFYKKSRINNLDWKLFISDLLFKVAIELKAYGTQNNIEYTSLGCTVNLALISDDLILTANIGDGRACYRSKQGDWKPMIKPFKGDEVGSTVFITTPWIWDNAQAIRTQIIKDKANAFALLTDGLEKYSYECYVKDENGLYCDPNTPFSPFFNANINALSMLVNARKTLKEIRSRLKSYLKVSKNLGKELDDKTLVLGFIYR